MKVPRQVSANAIFREFYDNFPLPEIFHNKSTHYG